MLSRVLGRSSRFTASLVASRARLPALLTRKPIAWLHVASRNQQVQLRRSFSTVKTQDDGWDGWDLDYKRPAGFDSDFSSPVPQEQETRKLLEWRNQNPQLTFKDIVKTYGWYPLAGLATVTMLSKEIIPFTEEFLLIFNFAAVVATLHVVIGNSAWEGLTETLKEEKKRMFDWDQFKIDLVDEKIADVKTRLQAPEVYAEYVREYVEAAKELNVFERVKPQHEFRTVTLKRLQDILNKELDQTSVQKKKLVQELLAHVRSQIESRAELRAATIDAAIQTLGARVPLSPKDTVAVLFNDFLTKNGQKPVVVA